MLSKRSRAYEKSATQMTCEIESVIHSPKPNYEARQRCDGLPLATHSANERQTPSDKHRSPADVEMRLGIIDQ
jgi:hypothetical protein